MEANNLAKLLGELKYHSERRKLFRHLPFGHPDTLCPDGALWKEMHEKGEWVEWTNKPWQLEFHNAGATKAERMLMCANGVGKSISGGYETAVHLTGLYPDWWEGKRFKEPVTVWVGSITNETQRDYTQPILLGPDLEDNIGTGFIPAANLVSRPRTRQCGISGVADVVRVKHKSGGISKMVFKVYEQGWSKWQGAAPNVIWMDEEPDENNNKQAWIFTEAQTRIFRSSGILYVTATPLLGDTELTRHFMYPKHESVWWVGATWDDSPHLKEADKDRLRATYPSWQVETRTKGVPMMGEGRIFKAQEDDIKIEPFEIPRHYARICGIDFGLDHPAAGAWLAWDRDRDVLYLYDCYRKEGREPLYHAEAINRRGNWIPVSWPHDGANREKSSGKRLADIYRDHGVNLLSKSARYKNEDGGSQPQWPVIEEIQERMLTDRFKVFSTLTDFFEEFRNYHTQDGKIISRRDDILKACFYAVMMKRYAITEGRKTRASQSVPILSTRI